MKMSLSFSKGRGGLLAPVAALSLALLSLVILFAQTQTSSNSLAGNSHQVKRHVDTSQHVTLTANITRRQENDYTCAVGRPCENHACCGKGGFCGYGPDYCGTGCSSNCDAKAECGKYAKVSGQTCPLNVCCSEHGFCGTTELYCNSKCQSNCVLHPSPPGGAGEGVLSKVIGYYESWNAFSNCRKTAPTDLPLDALTHVNYAFAYIAPGSFQITTMDGRTPPSLFRETTNLKSLKPGLEVWVSVGGWTFSDNGTATQPLLGEISRDPSKRQIFANNLLHFLEENAFDGFDLDWEYPGAPDRGGKPDDPENFVKLMATIRQTLNRSPRKLGISFTIPASYWYLRWFKVPELLQYSDFTSLMSYDLHGLWDKENPIGNVINPHTNLTEIQRAVELLWRVGVPPSKIALGFGFYGRSFRLADPSCTTPGVCQFSGDPNKGPCTDTSGYLSYYEIQDLIGPAASGSSAARRDIGNNITLETRQSGVQVKWDRNAAVKYFSYQGDQWISFDDGDTFKQKVDWANGVGFAGSLIWASDLDDNLIQAHQGLVGRTVADNNSGRQKAVGSSQAASDVKKGLNEACRRLSGVCVNVNSQDSLVQNCRQEGMEFVGWDAMGCGSGMGTPICCEKESVPHSCVWRGGQTPGFLGLLECNGQCNRGEVQLFGSSNGGFPGAPDSNLKKCSRGIKSFCCTQNDFPALTQGCGWYKCLNSCDEVGENMEEIARAFRKSCPKEKRIDETRGQVYCCPKYDHPYKKGSCKWRGTPYDCADAKCKPNEVTVTRHSSGDSWGYCDWGRKKLLCCEMDEEEELLTCNDGMCKKDPSFCFHDPEYDWEEDEDPADAQWDDYDNSGGSGEGGGGGGSGGSGQRRDASSFETGSGRSPRMLEKRDGKRRRFSPLAVIDSIEFLMLFLARAYPGPSTWTSGRNGRHASGLVYVPDDGNCQDWGVTEHHEGDRAIRNIAHQLDHVKEAQYIGPMLIAFLNGTLYSGRTLPDSVPRLSEAAYNKYWPENTRNLPKGKIVKPTPHTKKEFLSMNPLFGEVIGSLTTRDAFVGLEPSLNRIKGALFARNAPMSDTNFRQALNNAILSGRGESEFLTPMRRVFQVFQYMFTDNVAEVLRETRSRMANLVASLAREVPELAPIAEIWEEFDVDYYETVAQWARTWVLMRINEVLAALLPLQGSRQANRIARELRRMADSLARDDIIRAPPRNAPDDSDDDDDSDRGTSRPSTPPRFPGGSGGGGGSGGSGSSRLKHRDANAEHLVKVAELERKMERLNV